MVVLSLPGLRIFAMSFTLIGYAGSVKLRLELNKALAR